MRNTKEMVIRLPEDLHAELKERAAEDERSMASTMRFALRQYLKGAIA